MPTSVYDPAFPERGWQPAVPLPFFGRSLFLRRRFVCLAAVPEWPWGVLTKDTCRKRFKTRASYEQHYREAHLSVEGKDRP